MAIAPLQLPSSQALTPTLDFSPLSKIGEGFEKARKQQLLSDLGQGISDGSIDLNAAGGRVIGLGDLASGAALLKLGEEQSKRRAAEAADRQFLGSMPGAPTQSLASLDPNYGNAISGIESGGKYDATGPVTRTGDRAYGKYQVMGQNVGPWTQEVLGKPMTEDEFAANPQAQEAVFKTKFGQLVQKYGPEGAARAWFAGEGGMNDPNRRDQLGTSVAQYGQRFTSALGSQSQPQQVAQPAAPSSDVAPAQLSPRGQWAFRGMMNPNLSDTARKAAAKVYSDEVQALKPSEKVKTLTELKAASGYQGTILDLEKELRAAGKTDVTTNIDQKGESAEAKAAGDAAGKRRGEMFAAAGAASKTLVNLSRMEGMLSQVQQGKLSPAQYSVSTWAKSFGLNDDVAKSVGLDPKGAGTAQALQSLINESALGKIGSGGIPANNFSDADREFILGIFPRLSDEPSANKIRIEGARRLARLDIDRAKAFQQFKANPANKGKGFEDFELDWSDKISKQDIFGDLRKQAEQIIGRAQQQGQQPRMTQPDIDASLSNAKTAIARNPAARGAVIQRLRENGIDPSGL